MYRPAFIVLIVLAGVAVVPAPAVAADEYPGECSDAPVVDATGEYTGSHDTPQDNDAMRVVLDRGDYLQVRAGFPDSAVDPAILLPEPDYTIRNLSMGSRDASQYGSWIEATPSSETTFEFWAEESGTFCFAMSGDEDADIPYQWRLSLTKNSPTAPEFTPASDELQNRVESLESKLEEKNETIANLRSQLEETGSEEQRNLTIEIDVEPADGRQNFVSGGEAQVSVQNDDIDLSEIAVKFGSATYDLGGDGQGKVALIDAGTKELVVVYGDVRESVMLNVQERSGPADSQSQSAQEGRESDDLTDGSGPGFGITSVVVAVALLAVSGFRRD